MNNNNNEEDPNYPPQKPKNIKLNKKTRRRSIALKATFRKSSGKTQKATFRKSNRKRKSGKKEQLLEKKIDENIEWGLGIEHEFMLVVDGMHNVSQATKLLEKLNEDKLTTEQKKQLSNIYKNNNIFFLVPYVGLMGIKDINIEQTSVHDMPMFEVKNMKYHNVTLHEAVKEIDDKLNEVKTKMNEVITQKIGSKTTVKTTPFGAHNLLYLKCKNVNQRYGASHTGNFECLESKNLKMDTEYTGSYHFWITLPHFKTDEIGEVETMHQKAVFLLQTVEPLFCSLYGSCDPNINKKSTTPYLKGSYRAANNMYAAFGTSPASMYKDKPGGNDWYSSPIMFSRTVNKRVYTPKRMDVSIYSNNVAKHVTKRIDSDEVPDYMFMNGESNMMMGADFRRKRGIKGFEFRIWDHFPQEHVKDILKITYLISCYAVSIPSKHLVYSMEEQSWNNSMRDALLEGYSMKINNKYIAYINKQFKLKVNNKKESQKQLEHLIDVLWKKVMGNEVTKNMYLLMVGDDMKKPKVVNINKMSQEATMRKVIKTDSLKSSISKSKRKATFKKSSSKRKSKKHKGGGNLEKLFGKNNKSNVVQSGGHVSDVVRNVNATGKGVDILLGCHPSEEHVIKYKEKNNDKTVITFNDENDESINEPFHIKGNFNDIELWKQLKGLNNVQNVIVDWSTAKFLNKEYTIIRTHNEYTVFNIIFDMLQPGGSYYSYCCGTGMGYPIKRSYYEEHNIESRPPQKTIMMSKETKLPYVNMRADLTTEQYIEAIKHDLPDNMRMDKHGILKYDENLEDYPLFNPNMTKDKPYYFKLTKK